MIILRGLPGSGKSHIAKLIKVSMKRNDLITLPSLPSSLSLKDKEASYGAPVPRILSIDTYFINEVEKIQKDPDSGWLVLWIMALHCTGPFVYKDLCSIIILNIVYVQFLFPYSSFTK